MAPDVPRGADPFEEPRPAALVLAPEPELPVLVTFATPPPIPVDDAMLISLPPECRAPSAVGTLVRAARASLEAGIAAWRQERATARAIRAGLADGRRGGPGWRTPGAITAAWLRQRTGWGTLLAACTVTTVSTALLTSWAMTGMPRRGGETTATIPREVAATPEAAPGATADGSVTPVEGNGALLRTAAAAPARSGRRDAPRSVLSAPRTLETHDEVAAPVRAGAGEPRTVPKAAPSAVAEPSEPGADAQRAPDAAAPDSPARPNHDAEPEDVPAAPLATSASVHKDAGDRGAAPAAISALERAAPAPAEAVPPDGGPADGGPPSAPDPR